jgi:hypothetical protein
VTPDGLARLAAHRERSTGDRESVPVHAATPAVDAERSRSGF